jgi:hypothetical protein
MSYGTRRIYLLAVIAIMLMYPIGILAAQGRSASPKQQAGAQTVVAEGLGATPEDALKDAFRSAVRQVVGALVDEETVVKNDKVISEKVLSYSDGIIKGGYKELTPPRQENGLWRIKISAKVERRSVAVRLKEAHVTVKDIEGDSIAVEVLTRKEARERASELLQQVLSELPKVMAAEVRKPTAKDYNEDENALSVQALIKIDPDKYKKFLKRFLTVLDKIGLDKGTAVLEATPRETNQFYDGEHGHPRKGNEWWIRDAHQLAGPDIRQSQNTWCIWVLTAVGAPSQQSTPAPGRAGSVGSSQRSRWNWFVVDASASGVLDTLRGELEFHLSLQDENGEVIAEDHIPLRRKSGSRGMNGETPWLAQGMHRQKTADGPRRGTGTHFTLFEGLEPHNRKASLIDDDLTVNLFVAPWAFDGLNVGRLIYVPSLPCRCKFTLKEDELKRIKTVKGTVVFEPEKKEQRP